MYSVRKEHPKETFSLLLKVWTLPWRMPGKPSAAAARTPAAPSRASSQGAGTAYASKIRNIFFFNACLIPNRETTHFPCALTMPRWTMNQDQFEAYCPKHAALASW